ncbi:MAG: PspA/IM30 family protein [Planktomarina sp.]
MFKAIKTFVIGTSVRADNIVTDHFAIELIDQKIQETEKHLKAAKMTLASMIGRERTEAKLLKTLKTQITTLEQRATAAMNDGKQELALEAAQAIATMENEASLRSTTVDRLQEKITRLQSTVATNHRKVVELKQGAISAQAIHRETQLHGTMMGGGTNMSAAQEAQDLIDRVMGRDDSFEMSAIVTEIDEGLNGDTLTERMAAQGYGPSTKSTAQDILDRLKKS